MRPRTLSFPPADNPFGTDGPTWVVSWEQGVVMTCGCPYSLKQVRQYGVAYCIHISKTLGSRIDTLDSFKTVNPLSVVAHIPIIFDISKDRAWKVDVELPEMTDGTLEVWLKPSLGVRLGLDGPVGYVRPTNGRADLIEMIRPYLIEWHTLNPCLGCGFKVSRAELATTGGQMTAVVAAMEVLSNDHRLCLACKDLIPDI